ncbi:DMT family transporter [Runella aurantiaca]|uniref:DMT family transporter n=1 Tax=Runella aurantiaca TaxID=2282308 RepID=A0A369IIE1_9BACT|nr:DMT family transporter [Runella aurantiaca]RDB07153.1 DMT family transporter [Runella aurantiaca]
MNYFFLLLAFLIGVTNTFQSGVNSQLRLATQNPILSSILSFVTGLCVLLVCYLLFNKDAIPSFETFRSISWWKWLGGVFGAFYVLTVILIVKEIGPANLLCLIIAGQLVAGVLIDHFGWVGFAVHPMNIWRIFGIGLIIVGGVLVLKN